jgi:hypothetical protein
MSLTGNPSVMDWRDKALEMVDKGLVDARHMVLILVKYMTQDDVEGALDANELTPRFTGEDAWLYESDDDSSDEDSSDEDSSDEDSSDEDSSDEEGEE